MKCISHPDYIGKRPPKNRCSDCWTIFLNLNPERRGEFQAEINEMGLTTRMTVIDDPDKEVKKKVVIEKCTLHKQYRGNGTPKSDCQYCWKIYQFTHNLSDEQLEKIQRETTRSEQRKNEKINDLMEQRTEVEKSIKSNTAYNILFIIKNFNGKTEFNHLLKKSLERRFKTIFINQPLKDGGSGVLYVYDDISQIKKMFTPYTEKIKMNMIHLFIVLESSKLNKIDKEPDKHLYEPDAGAFNMMAYDLDELSPMTFERAIGDKLDETFIKKIFFKQKYGIK